jgi:acetyltransferase-like isoleucine patch superfamily enzyme
MMRKLLGLFTLLLPWPLRRGVLSACFGYQLHSTARIGLAWVFPDKLVMGAGTSIGHLTVCKGLALMELGAHSTIGRGNWISGYPKDGGRHFTHRVDRRPELRLGEHAAITNRHIIDCTDLVEIGAFSTFAGFRSQILTHSIDLKAGRQSCAPVRIGSYCFVGTGCTLLGGSVLPDYSALGAMSLLNSAFEESHTLYGGVPARAISRMDPSLPYFTRTRGFVD